MPDANSVSIIIPVLNEARQFEAALGRLLGHPGIYPACEIIVCDGGSSDATLDIVRRFPVKLVQSARGRAIQMNAGAATARGKTLLFLHADCELPASFIPAQVVGAAWGFFHLRLSGGAFVYRVIETMINWRTNLTRVAGGDQGLFFEREFFAGLGGFPEIPLMEDIAISKRARRQRDPLVLGARITSSSRRWQQQGVIRTVLLMWSLRLAFWLGVKPERLYRIYYPQRG